MGIACRILSAKLNTLDLAQIASESFEGWVNEELCKLIGYNLVSSARDMRMRGVVPGFLRKHRCLTELFVGCA